MKTFGVVEVQLHTFIAPAIDGDEWSASHPATLPTGKEPLALLDRRLGGPQSRSGRDGEEKCLFFVH